MNIRPFKAIYPRLDLVSSPDVFFATVKHEFPNYHKSGFFVEHDEQALFIHDIQGKSRRFTGLIACADIKAYLDGQIVKHEETLELKEKMTIELLLERHAMIKPVLVMYREHPDIAAAIARAMQTDPFFSVPFESEDETHDFYKISDPHEIDKLRSIFDEHVPKAYIADGHHRCATNAKLYQTVTDSEHHPLGLNDLLTVFLPMDELVVHDYNRVIEVLHEISPTLFLARVSALCDIEHMVVPAKPKVKHEITLYLDHEWYRLRWKPHVLDKYREELVMLDGAILNQEVLNDILNIEDVRNDNRLNYVQGISGIEGVMAKTQKSAFRIGFCIYPVSVEELVAVADAGDTLPPKSTWFEPRVKNGLIGKSL